MFNISNLTRGGRQKRRIEFIDLAKGICIILVVVLHAGGPEHLPIQIQMLRMPLYFVLSGLFFKDYGGFLQLLVKKTNKILIPFVFFYLISYFMRYFLILFTKGKVSADDVNLLDVFQTYTLHNGPLWFLLALYWCHLIFCAISLNIKSELYRFFAVAAVGCIGAVIGSRGIFVPCFINHSLTYLPLFYVEYLLKKSPILYPNKYDKFNLLFAIILCGIAIILYPISYSGFGFSLNNVPNTWLLYMLACIMMVIGALLICKIIKKLPVISYFGRYSIIVLCTHFPVISIVVLIMRKINIQYWWADTLVTLLVCWALIPLFIRFLPYVTAQKDLIKLPEKHKNN